jgi:calcineurin-like phosphoesterase family protein
LILLPFCVILLLEINNGGRNLNKTFIAADMRLFDATAAQSKKTNLWGYNQMVIDKINEVVGEDDYLIVFGDITFGSLEDSKEFLS